MNLTLNVELEELIASKMATGRYLSATEVITDALRLLDYRDQVLTSARADIGSQIEEGWHAAACGDLVDPDEVFDRIDAELALADPAR